MADEADILDKSSEECRRAAYVLACSEPSKPHLTSLQDGAEEGRTGLHCGISGHTAPISRDMSVLSDFTEDTKKSCEPDQCNLDVTT